MTDINLRQIEVFLSVAKHQNISRAASELFITQSSTSKWISSIEETLGVELFRRTNRGVVLTEAGEELYDHLEFEYQHFRVNVGSVCARHAAKGLPLLRVGCLNRQVIFDLTMQQCQTYALTHPDVQVTYERFDYQGLQRKLLCDELEFILTLSTDAACQSEFAFRPVSSFPVFFIVPHDWARAQLTELSGKNLLILTASRREWAESVCQSYGIVPSKVQYVSSYSALITQIFRGVGFSIDGKLSDSGSRLHDVAYLPVDPKYSNTNEIVLAWRRERQSELTASFADFLKMDADG